MTLRLNGSTSGYTEIDAPAVAGSNTLVLPTGAGSANQFLKNGSTAGSLGWSSVVEDSSGRLLVGTSSAAGRADYLQIQSDSGATTNGASILLRSGKATGTITTGDILGQIRFSDSSGDIYATVKAEVDAATGSNDFPSRLVFSTTADGASSPTERMRINANGFVFLGKTSDNFATAGFAYRGTNSDSHWTVDANSVVAMRRNSNDGDLIQFYQDSAQEGSISVSGTTVSYNGAHLSRWSQILDTDPHDKEQRPEILRGTVMSNLDEMCDWIDSESGESQDNEQLNKTKISDVEGDKNVAGVFQSWDDDDDTWVNDYYLAMTGDFIIRIAGDTTVERGDLLMSAGDGTAKPQGDGYVQDKTIAKVTSTNVSCTYEDGSYCVPCVLMAC